MIFRALVALAVLGAVAWGGSTRAPATAVLAIVCAAALVAAWWEARAEERALKLAPLALPALAMAGLGLLSLVPVPPGLRALLSPAGERVAREVLAGLPHPSWRPLTADAAATLDAVVRALAVAALAVALSRAGRERHRVFLRGTLAAALVVLMLPAMLAQVGITLPEPLAWVSERALAPMPLRNPNHVGALLGLVLPLLVALAARQRGALLVGCITLVVVGNVALVATVSRAGIAVGWAAQGVVLFLVVRELGSRRVRAVGGALALALAVALALSARPLIQRLSPASLASQNKWSNVAEVSPIVRDHFVSGIGRGTLRYVFPRYSAKATRHQWAWVENTPVEVVLDVGVPGALLVLLVSLLAIKHGARSFDKKRLSARAAVVGLAGLLLHDLVDFSLEGGAVAAAACVVAALAVPSAGRALRPRGPLALAAATLLAALLLLSPRGTSAEAEGQKVRALAADRALDRARFLDEATPLFVRHASDGYLADLIAERLLGDGDRAAFDWIGRALTLGPWDPHAHRLFAEGLGRLGLHAEAAAQLRVALEHAQNADLGSVVREALALLAGRDGDQHLCAALEGDQWAHQAAMERLAPDKRDDSIVAVGTAALAQGLENPPILRYLLEAQLRRGDRTKLAERAERLLALDGAAANVELATRALTAAGDAPGAERLLERAVSGARGHDMVELSAQLVGKRVQRGDFAGARTAIEEALARAVSGGDKARLHRLRADLEDRAGNPNRAALERAEAVRAERH
jgi:hypothetical protein